LSQKLAIAVGAQNDKTYPTYDIAQKETKTSQFFQMQTRRLALSFKNFNSSLAHSPSKLWSCKVVLKKWPMLDFKVKIFHTLAANTLISFNKTHFSSSGEVLRMNASFS